MAFTTFDNAPYLYRKSGGGGDKEIDKLVGGTIAWNQLAKELASPNYVALRATLTYSDGVATATATESGGTYGFYQPTSYRPVIAGHKYLVSADFTIGTNSSLKFGFVDTPRATVTTNTTHRIAKILSTATSGNSILMYQDTNVQTGQSFSVQNLMMIDLTLMFGSTIADYVYSLEQSSQGSGLAWLRSYGFFTEDYYDYNSGELKSVSNLVSHDMTGFNQWDEKWELGAIIASGNYPSTTNIRSKNYIPCMGGATYFSKCSAQIVLFQYDKNKALIRPSSDPYVVVNSNSTFTTLTNAHYMRFYTQPSYGTTYKNDICINLSSSRNGEYEPYTLQSYPLGDVTLRGLPKLNGNALYYDGDTYESNGTVTRKYGVVDLGTLSWSYSSTANHERMQTTGLASVIKSSTSTSRLANILCSAYKTITADGTYNHSEGIGIAVSINGTVFVYDTAYTDAASFKTAMSGVYLVYELASSTTETADTYTNPQWVDPNGTEKYTLSTNAFPMPVGHETTYNTDIGSKTVNTQVNLSMTEPQVRQVYAKEGDTARVLNIHLDQTEENGMLRILRPDGTEVTADAVLVPDFYDGLMAEIPSNATEIVGKCYCDVEQNGVSSMPFTLNVKKNERQ